MFKNEMNHLRYKFRGAFGDIGTRTHFELKDIQLLIQEPTMDRPLIVEWSEAPGRIGPVEAINKDAVHRDCGLASNQSRETMDRCEALFHALTGKSLLGI
jgi:hypothetical protein